MVFRHLKGFKRWFASASAALVLAGGPGMLPEARAQENNDIKELRQRLEALEKQNKELIKKLDEPQPAILLDRAGAVAPAAAVPADDLRKAVEGYLADKDAKAKDLEAIRKKEIEENGYTIGDDLKMGVRWDHGLVAESADKAFKIHVGGRTQLDTVWYNVGDDVQFGNNGVGRVDDGVAFRRARLKVEGTLWEVIDFDCEYDFLNTDTLARDVVVTRNAAGDIVNVVRNPRVINTPAPTDLWVQFRNPYLNVRVGNLKPAIGFEHNTSSRFLNFMERSYAFDAYVGGPDNGFSPGVLAFRNFADDRVHFSTSVTKFTQTIFGNNTGDGEYAFCARTGVFPIWEDEGRVALWVGCGYRHNDADFIVGSNRQFVRQTDGQIRLRARTELRNGPAELHTPLLDIFPFASSQDLLNPEVAFVCGPWTAQAEYFASWVNDARAAAADPLGVTQFTSSAYVEVLYFLTGEHRVFNRQIPGFARVVPHENVWLTKGDSGPLVGRGAWQVGARYSWIDLADKGVLGGNNTTGSAQAVTLGLNWFMNPNMKLQWNYTYEQRYQINTVGPDSPNAGLTPDQASNGDLRGFGMRMAIDF